MTEMFGEAWLPMSVPDLAPDDDDDEQTALSHTKRQKRTTMTLTLPYHSCLGRINSKTGYERFVG